jgi:hypothetical protein
MDNNQREERRRQEDIALNRGLIWVGAAIVLELLLLLVNKYYINIYTTVESVNRAVAIGNVLKAVRIISLVGIVACAVWLWLNLKKRAKLTAPIIMLIACAALLFCSHVTISFYDSGLQMLFLLVPAWAALALVYYLYQRDFFISGAISGMGVVALWLIRHQSGQQLTVYLFLALMVVVLIVVGLFLSRVRKAQGSCTVAGRTVQVLPLDANYTLILISAVINVAAVALALALGGTVAYYLMYAVVAWLFGLLVYYTVKMM